jgi:hypothetical protein
MRRFTGVVITILAGPLTWLIQDVFRPAAVGYPTLLAVLGPAPNVVVGLCFPFAALSYPFESAAQARRGVVAATLITIGVLVALELWRPIHGAQTYDPLDLAGSALGGLIGAALALTAVRRILR